MKETMFIYAETDTYIAASEPQLPYRNAAQRH